MDLVWLTTYQLWIGLAEKKNDLKKLSQLIKIAPLEQLIGFSLEGPENKHF